MTEGGVRASSCPVETLRPSFWLLLIIGRERGYLDGG